MPNSKSDPKPILTIGRKLIFGVIIMLALVTVIIAAGVTAINKIGKCISDVKTESLHLDAIRNLRFSFQKLLMPPNDYLINGNIEEKNNFEELLNNLNGRMAAAAEIEEHGGCFSKKELDVVSENALKIESLARKIFSLNSPVGNPEGARMMKEMDASADKAINNLGGMLNKVENDLNKAMEAANEAQSSGAKNMIIIGLVIIFGGLTGGLLFARGIARPVNQLTEAVQRVSSGDLTARAEILTHDEIGALAVSFNKMADNLKKNREELAAAIEAEKTAELMEAISEGVIAIDPDGRITYINTAFEKLTGYARGELVGELTINILYPEREKEKILSARRSVFEKADPNANFETTVLRKDKSEVPIMLNAAPLKNQDGKITGAIAVFHDISEIKQAQEKEKEFAAAEKSREFFEAMTEGVCAIDADGRITGLNAAFEKLTGYTRDELAGTSPIKLHPESEKERLVSNINEVMERGFVRNFETIILRKDKKETAVILDATSLKDEKTGINGAIAVFRDITELKQAQEALQKSGEWLLTTLKSIGDAVIATDSKGNVSLMNPVSENLTGWKQEEAAGKPAENPAERVMKEGVVVGLANHTVLIAKDGTKYPIDDSGAPIKDDKGNIIGVILVFRDISEQKAVQIQLEERLRDLERFQKFAVDRENRIIELKEKVKELEARLDGE